MPSTTTLNETARAPLDGTEQIRLATAGANWKAQVNQPNAGGVAWPFGTVAGGTGAASSLTLESTTGAGTSDFIAFKTASQTERVRITTGGLVTINTGGAPLASSTNNQVQIVCDTNVNNVSNWVAFNGFAGLHFFDATNGATANTQTAVTAGQTLHEMHFRGSDGTAFREAAQIYAACDLTPATSTTPGRLTFETTPAGTSQTPIERFRIDSGGLASFTNTNGFGYGLAGNGDGGTVTQVTSRTTGVTLSKICGAITLFAAAPTVGTWVSFTVTNTKVAALDTVIVCFKSGTNTYVGLVSAVAAGSFQITFQSVAGTASDSPVINFAVVKAVTT